jgi:ADP-ribose pyrophosphatase
MARRGPGGRGGADADELVWPLDRSDELGDYRHFRVQRHWCRSPRDGETRDFYILDMPDWVQVIPVTAEGRFVLVEQFRPGTRRVTLEFPAGLVDGGEAPIEAAVRELAEETGYRGGNAMVIRSYDPNPALQNNRLHIVVVDGCRATGDRDQDPGEAIRVRLASEDELEALIHEGRFETAFGMVAWECYRRYR